MLRKVNSVSHMHICSTVRSSYNLGNFCIVQKFVPQVCIKMFKSVECTSQLIKKTAVSSWWQNWKPLSSSRWEILEVVKVWYAYFSAHVT